MNRLIQILAVALVILIVGTGVFLAGWDLPAPTAPVERTIPNDRFQR